MAVWRKQGVWFASLVLVFGVVSGAGHEGGHGEQHLERVIASYRGGDFEGAWQAYRAFFQHPHKNLVAPDVFVECFGYVQCPGIGALGSVLGRTADQAGPFASFCPQWPPADDPEEAAESREASRTLIEAILGSCEQYARKTASLLPASARESPPRPQVVPFRLPPRDPNDPRPHVGIEVLDQPALALVDTGATISGVNRLLGAVASNRLRVDWLRARYEMDFARLDTLTIQDAVYLDVPAILVDLTWTDDGEPVPRQFGSTVGMDILLRHEAVCFDLRARQLHLGSLGPCAAGEANHEAWLHGSHSLYVSVPTAGGHAMPAKFDTGSRTTFCSEAFLEAHGGRNTFSLGEHAAMSAVCVSDPDVAFAGVGSGQKQVLLGMDMLQRLDAFGWRLNPLDVRLVFAPDKRPSP